MFFKQFSRILFVLVLSTVVISAQEYPPSGVPETPDENTLGSLGVQLITQFLTGDFVRHKLQVLFDLIDLKARLVYAISSFCTTENLIALKRFLDWICRLANFMNQFLPNIPEDDNPKTALLGLVLNTFNTLTSTGSEHNPATSYGPPSYGPPKSDEAPSFVSVSTSNKKRSPMINGVEEAEKPTPNDVKLTDLSEEDVKTMLNNNEGVMMLSKLISASRR